MAEDSLNKLRCASFLVCLPGELWKGMSGSLSVGDSLKRKALPECIWFRQSFGVGSWEKQMELACIPAGVLVESVYVT